MMTSDWRNHCWMSCPDGVRLLNVTVTLTPSCCWTAMQRQATWTAMRRSAVLKLWLKTMQSCQWSACEVECGARWRGCLSHRHAHGRRGDDGDARCG